MEEEEGVRTGGCLCGAVRYSVRGEPVHVRLCHCAECRKESGSAFSVHGLWPVEAFEISGEISSYDSRGFCPRCGSRLLDVADPGGRLVEIRLGSLDEAPFELRPEDEIWVKRRESWIPPIDGAEQHPERSHPDEDEARAWVATEIARLRSMRYSELLAQPLDTPAHHSITSRTGRRLMGESVVFRDNSEEGRKGGLLAALVSVDEPRPGVVTPIAQDSFIRRPDGSFVGE